MNSPRHNLAWLALVVVLLLGGCDDDDKQARSTGDVDAGSHGDVDAGSDPCVSCELAAGGSCSAGAVDNDLVTFSQTLSQWSASCSDAGTSRYTIAEGRCGNGKTFLLSTGGKGATRRYFDDAGVFLSATAQSDAVDQTCLGKHYWPTLEPCNGGLITQVICGPLVSKGQSF